MGIEIPESYGGAGATSSTRCWRSRRCRGSTRRSACSSTCRTRWSSTRCCAGAATTSSSATCRSWRPSTIGAYALSEAGSGSDAFALATRAAERGDDWPITGRKLWITNGNEADLFIVFANVNPDAGYRGITAFLVERGFAGLHRRQEGRQARHPRQQHLRAAVRGLPRAARERARRGRQGLQGRDRDAERRAHRHRRADDRPRAGRARSRDRLHARSASSSARRSPSSRPCSSSSRAPRPRSRRRGCWSTTRRGCATPGSRSSRKRRCARSSRRRWPSASTSLAVNLFGGYGFVKDYPVEKLYRDAKIGQIYEGTSNLQLQTIAKQLLG